METFLVDYGLIILISWFASGFLVTSAAFIGCMATGTLPSDVKIADVPVILINGTALGWFMLIIAMGLYIQDKWKKE